ncbi:MAG: DUF4416 family protein [Candidatus Omnitrophica bacterium]|nr:DUF4416 family protein [Candidatus Omnitrophota bacterium]
MKTKLIAGLIAKSNKAFEEAKRALVKHFGKVDFESDVLDFDYTDYYEKEFGRDLKRKFLSFKKPAGEDELARIKTLTNGIEKVLSENGRRRVNIDPGCLSLGKLILATTKDNSHRIYLGKGIFAEVTLRYIDGGFKPLEWTYPDYRSKEYLEIFEEIRRLYKDGR